MKDIIKILYCIENKIYNITNNIKDNKSFIVSKELIESSEILTDKKSLFSFDDFKIAIPAEDFVCVIYSDESLTIIPEKTKFIYHKHTTNNKNIINYQYGIGGKFINFPNIPNKLLKQSSFRIENWIFNNDPVPNVRKKLIIYYDDQVRYIIPEYNIIQCVDLNNDNTLFTNENNIQESDSIIYVLYYDDETKKKVTEKFGKYSWAKPFFNRSDKYLENNFYQRVMLKKEEWINKKFVGCLSHKFTEKCPKINIDQILQTWGDTDVDVIGLYVSGPTFLGGSISSIQSVEILKKCMKILYGMNIEHFLNFKPFYCNYWLCRPSVLLKYIYFVDEIIEKMEMNQDMSTLLYGDSGYGRNALNINRKYQIFGKPYYTWHPFVMERLLPIFCYANEFKIHIV